MKTLKTTLLSIISVMLAIPAFAQYTPGRYPEGSTRYLTDYDLVGKTSYELKIMRNEIYARHGYIFKTDDMISYFNSQAWYTPRSRDVSLTTLEKKNVALIKSYEKGGAGSLIPSDPYNSPFLYTGRLSHLADRNVIGENSPVRNFMPRSGWSYRYSWCSTPGKGFTAGLRYDSIPFYADGESVYLVVKENGQDIAYPMVSVCGGSVLPSISLQVSGKSVFVTTVDMDGETERYLYDYSNHEWKKLSIITYYIYRLIK